MPRWQEIPPIKLIEGSRIFTALNFMLAILKIIVSVFSRVIIWCQFFGVDRLVEIGKLQELQYEMNNTQVSVVKLKENGSSCAQNLSLFSKLPRNNPNLTVELSRQDRS